MWHDKYETRLFDDDRVKVDRWISSPATPDEVHLHFSDGSLLIITLEVPPAESAGNEVAAAEVAKNTTGWRAYHRLMTAIIDRAHEIRHDVDHWLEYAK